MKSYNACYTFLFIFFGITFSQDARAQGVIVWAETFTEVKSVNAGDTVAFTIAVHNNSAVSTATNPVVTVNLPAGASNVNSANCVSVATTTLSCALTELGPKASATFSLTAALNNEGHNVVEALISVDQHNSKPAGHSSDTATSIVMVTTAEALANRSLVDLSIELDISSSTELIMLYPAVVTLKNLHSTNTAIAPFVELPIPEGWATWSGKHCDPTGRRVNSGEVVRCLTAPLSPMSELDLTLYYKPVAIDGSNVLSVQASSTQPEQNTRNNTANIDVAIVPTVFKEILCGASNPLCAGTPDNTTDNSIDNASPDIKPAAPPSTTPSATSENSGGGALALSPLLVISGCIFWAFRRRFTGLRI